MKKEKLTSEEQVPYIQIDGQTTGIKSAVGTISIEKYLLSNLMKLF